jgi:hypothetical protein
MAELPTRLASAISALQSMSAAAVAADEATQCSGRKRSRVEALVHKYTHENGDLDGNAGSGSVVKPWDYRAFADRLGSFRPHTWFGKDASLHAILCARHGWENMGRDKLCCKTCGVRVQASGVLHLNSGKGSTSVSATTPGSPVPSLGATRLFGTSEELKAAHLDSCPWRSAVSPPEFGTLFYAVVSGAGSPAGGRGAGEAAELPAFASGAAPGSESLELAAIRGRFRSAAVDIAAVLRSAEARSAEQASPHVRDSLSALSEDREAPSALADAASQARRALLAAIAAEAPRAAMAIAAPPASTAAVGDSAGSGADAARVAAALAACLDAWIGTASRAAAAAEESTEGRGDKEGAPHRRWSLSGSGGAADPLGARRRSSSGGAGLVSTPAVTRPGVGVPASSPGAADPAAALASVASLCGWVAAQHAAARSASPDSTARGSHGSSSSEASPASHQHAALRGAALCLQCSCCAARLPLEALLHPQQALQGRAAWSPASLVGDGAGVASTPAAVHARSGTEAGSTPSLAGCGASATVRHLPPAIAAALASSAAARVAIHGAADIAEAGTDASASPGQTLVAESPAATGPLVPGTPGAASASETPFAAAAAALRARRASAAACGPVASSSSAGSVAATTTTPLLTAHQWFCPWRDAATPLSRKLRAAAGALLCSEPAAPSEGASSTSGTPAAEAEAPAADYAASAALDRVARTRAASQAAATSAAWTQAVVRACSVLSEAAFGCADPSLHLLLARRDDVGLPAAAGSGSGPGGASGGADAPAAPNHARLDIREEDRLLPRPGALQATERAGAAAAGAVGGRASGGLTVPGWLLALLLVSSGRQV